MNYAEEIKKLKKEKDALILVHYYQPDDIQDIADYLGDSLYLSQLAEKSDAKVIIFCGVHFMAETAKILSPEKRVFIPAKNAGCRMADMISAKALKKYKDEHPGVKIITYVNSDADVKALSDCCVTSTNAMGIIKHYLDNNEKIMYCPDQNLAKYAMKKMNVKFDYWPGMCVTHHMLQAMDVLKLKKQHPDALLLAHPECNLKVLDLADYIGSTRGIINYAKDSDKKEFIIATEEGVIHQMKKNDPNKKYYIASSRLKCPYMKKSTIEQVYDCLKNESNEVFVDEDIASKARIPLEKMMELTK